MNYKEAQLKSLEVPWQYEDCSSENCWCGCIATELSYKQPGDTEETPFYVCGSGGIDKELAKYIVSIHNEKLEYDQKINAHSKAIQECMKNGSQR